MSPQPKVALVVVTYNSAEHLPGLIDSLPEGLREVPSHQLIVVDNNSGDGSLQEAARLAPEAESIQLGRNGGYAAGINAGVALAQNAEAFLVLNADIRLGPGSVRALLDGLGSPGTGIAVPRLLDGEGRIIRSLRRDPSVLRTLGEALLGGTRSGRFGLLGEVIQDSSFYERPSTADWATGAAMAISRSCLETVGTWDESFFLYSEETDFAIRAREAGFRLRLVPDAWAIHIGGQQHASPFLWTVQKLSKLKLFSRRHGRVATLAFWAALVTNESLRALLGRQPHRAALRALLFPGQRPRIPPEEGPARPAPTR